MGLVNCSITASRNVLPMNHKQRPMSKLTSIIAIAILLSSCQKQETGVIYKAFHEYEDSKGRNGVATDFFKMPSQDDNAALSHYKDTEAYRQISTWTDTTYIQYYCTIEEWKQKGEEGMKIN